MDRTTAFWYQSAAAGPEPEPPVGVELIGNSIRYLSQAYTTQRVVGTAGSTSRCTISMWSKGIAPNTTGNNGPADQPCAFASRVSDGSRKFRFTNTDIFITNNNGGTSFASAQFANTVRWFDNNGWTNTVISLDTTQATDAECVRAWVNGVSIPLIFGTPGWNGEDLSIFTQGNTMNLFGGWGNNNPGSGFNQVVGYHTEFRIVDGQALTQEAFGVFNNEGIWSPRPEDEVNTRVGDYGTNGAYLGFEDPNVTTNTDNLNQAIFLDTAPIDTDHSAANNFTGAVNGGRFVVSPARIFSNDLTTNTSFSAADPRTDVFNNSTADGCDAVGGGAAVTTRITFAPTVPFTNLSSLEVFNGVISNQQSIFGGTTTQNLATSQWVNIPLGTATELSTASPLVIERQEPSASVQINAIRVNGVVLVDNLFQQDVDWTADSPSNNFALINTQCTDANVQTVESGNCSFIGNNTVFNLNCNVGSVPDKFYYEINNRRLGGDGDMGTIAFGVGTEDQQNPDVLLTVDVGDFNTRGDNNGQFGFAVDMTAAGAGETTTGCVFVFDRTENAWIDGPAANLTDNNINGGNSNAVAQFTYNADLPLTFFIRSKNGVNNNANSFYNFGQFGFFNAVPNTYATGLLATSFANPTVEDGSDGFRVVEAPGPAILTVAQGRSNDINGSTGFGQGMWWIKNVGDTNRWQYVDNFTISGVRNIDNVWITPNTTTGQPYTPPPNASVAYCHSTTETWTAAGIGEGFRNPSSQFSMLTYTGDGTTNRDVPHGLNSPPGMIWLYNPEGGDVKVFMSGLQGDGTATRNLILNTNEAAGNVFSAGIIQRPNATTFRPGLSSDTGSPNVNGVNRTGRVYRAYCWATVPGYSAFGSFRSGGGGPGVTNGAFIYTGFAPRTVIIKSNGADNWTVMDTVQNENNQADNNPTTFLIFNETNAATTIGGNSLIQIRFLSNGFKIVGSNGQIGNTTTLPGAMYAAFAASPFGGSDVQPGTSQLQAPQATPASAGASITNSLRFRGTQFLLNEDLARPAGDYTLSMWLKISATQNDAGGLYCADTSVNDGYNISRSDEGIVRIRTSAGFSQLSDGNLRDPGAWYNLIFQNDGGTTALFINGQRQANTGSTFPASDTTIIGAANQTPPDEPLRGYLADYYLAENIVEPSGFGTYNNEGIWVPHTEAVITKAITDAGGYGTGGFKFIFNQSNIKFTSPPTLEDQSGNNNDFEMHNFELGNENDSDFDLMVDGPATNFALLNRLIGTAGNNITEAALQWSASTTNQASQTIALPTEGNYYFEATLSANNALIGITQVGDPIARLSADEDVAVWLQNFNAGSAANATRTPNSTLTAGAATLIGTPCVFGVEWDADAGTFEVFRNGESQYTVGTITLDGPYYLQVDRNNTDTTRVDFNFGQQPFQFQPADTDSLHCRNLPAAPVISGAAQFRNLEAAGADISAVASGTTTTDTHVSGQPDTGFGQGLWWIKDITAGSTQWQMQDPFLRASGDSVAQSPSRNVAAYAAPANNSLVYAWNTTDTSVTNNDGAVESNVWVNTTAGLSCMQWVGTGANTTVGHGLTGPIDFLVVKAVGPNDPDQDTRNFTTFTTGFTGNSPGGDPRCAMFLNSNAFASDTPFWGNPGVFNPNNSGTDVICVGTDPDVNRAATNMVAWAWTTVTGYSSFGRYTGNGDADASGPFIYTGFAPAAVCVKSQEVARNWIWETKVQNQTNPANTFLSTNLEEAEATNDNQAIDFLSNGFKIRSSDNDVNEDGELYIYCAWAQSPFGGNNVTPANAQ